MTGAVALIFVIIGLVGQFMFSGGGAPAQALSSAPLQTGIVIAGSLERNPVYAAARLGGDCHPPEVDDPESRPAFLNAMADCMDRSWGVIFQAAGVHFTKPSRIFFTKPAQSPCGFPGRRQRLLLPEQSNHLPGCDR